MSLSFEDMSRYNRIMILNLIRRKETISRANLVRETGLTAPSISRITSELMEKNLIEESGRGESSVGRKPIMLRFNAGSRSIIGLDLRPDRISGIITDLNPRSLRRYDREFSPQKSRAKVLAILRQLTEKLVREAEEIAPLLGIGMALPGVVDVEEGELSYSAPLGWSNVNMRDVFADSGYDDLLKIDNLAHAVALGEKWLGSGSDRDNFVYVYVGKGIGAGIIANGRLYHGSEYNAAEIGHTTINFNGPRCYCGNRGCLETYCSTGALQEQIEDKLEVNIESEEELWQVLNTEEMEVTPVIKKSLDYLGTGIANLINIFNPETIIIGGWPQKVGYNGVLSYLTDVIRERSMQGLTDNLELKFSYEDEDMGPLLGAATLVLEDYLKESLIKQ